MRFYNAAQDEARKIEEGELNRTLYFYRQTQKEWKREYRKYKKGKKQSNEAYISFAQWNQDKLEALSKAEPEQFKDYCNGYATSSTLKAGGVAATALAPYLAVPLIGLGMWLTGGLSLLAGIGLIAAGAAVRIGAPLVGRRYLARRNLINVLSNPSVGAKQTKLKLFNRTKGERIVQTLTYNNEETRKLPFFARVLKRARMPKIIQAFFDTNKGAVEKADVDVEAVVKAAETDSKEAKKKEWYKENLATAEQAAEKAAEKAVEVVAEKPAEKTAAATKAKKTAAKVETPTETKEPEAMAR